MRKRYLTFDDLYDYFSSNFTEDIHFSVENSNDSSIVVQVPGKLVFESSNEDHSKDNLTPVTLQACHIGKNLNQFFISEETMTTALPSFENRPILAYIHEIDGQKEFSDHRRHKEGDKTIYDERPVGIIPESCNARLEYDEDKGKTYVCVDGYIYDIYSDAKEILTREQECDVSIEIEVLDLGFSAKEKVLTVSSFFFNGVTILGKREDGTEVDPGMAGSNIQLVDFSKEENSCFDNKKIVSMLEELKTLVNTLNNKNKEGGKTENMSEKLQKLLEQYNVEIEDVTFDYSEMSDEELEAKFAEVFSDSNSDNETENSEESDAEEFDANTENFEEDNSEEGKNEDCEKTEDAGSIETTEEASAQFSLKMPLSDNQFYELSLDEIEYSLSNLVNATYSESDNDYYFVRVYPESKKVIMVGWSNSYRQSYSETNGEFALEGEREQVYSIWVNEEEQKALEDMKKNFEANEKKLLNYESEPEKLEILNSSEYSMVANTEEFMELKKQENHFELSKEEIRAKADAIIVECAKHGRFDFASNDKPMIPTVTLLPYAEKTGRVGKYDDLVAKYGKKRR